MPGCRIHITGASGSGVTTLGRAMADALAIPHHDTDDYYWLPTDPPFQQPRDILHRIRLMQEMFLPRDAWVLSGSCDSWADKITPLLDLVVFLHVPTEIRLHRLRDREARRGFVDPEFMEWASHYDDGTREGRSMPRHEAWLKTLSCPVLRLDGTLPLTELVDRVLAAIPPRTRKEPSVTQDDLNIARRWFAEDLRYVARVRSPAIIDAFAIVPREHFAGPGPWRLLSPMYLAEYWTTQDADPRHLCHDVLIAIDEARRLNNGQPSLWAFLYDQLGLTECEHVVHVGIGTGYYTAILAEIVGGGGTVTAVEVDAELAGRARQNLARTWPQAHVVQADGFTFRPDRPADAIIVNAGVTHLSLAWLDSLAEDGRLLVPLTAEDRFGACVLITRRRGDKRCYAARNVCRVGIIDCIGGRDPEAETRLARALRGSRFVPPVGSLRRPPDEPDDTCWLAGDGWWLSTAPPDA
jgi:protein-L-isoaspartate(D-aspartate) O-methyltransferase